MTLDPPTPGGLYSSTYPAGWVSRNGPVMLDSSFVSSLCLDGSTLYAGLLSNYIASHTGGFIMERWGASTHARLPICALDRV